MMVKSIKRTREQQNKKVNKVPTYFILRAEYNGKESFRQLIDDVHFVSWNAGNSRDSSKSEAMRYSSWWTSCPDTMNFILQSSLKAQFKQLQKQQKLLTEILQEPHVVHYESLVYYLEPFDDDEFEEISEIQKNYLVQLREEAERKEHLEKVKKLKGLMKNRKKKK